MLRVEACDDHGEEKREKSNGWTMASSPALSRDVKENLSLLGERRA
jgi:hypothetical protein